jgi:drug/metabolite transporter (DMT)-like permease
MMDDASHAARQTAEAQRTAEARQTLDARLTHDAGAASAASRRRIVLAEVAVVIMALIWGVNYSVIKFGTSIVPPLAYNGVRVALAALAMLMIAILWGGTPPRRRDVFSLLALGMLGNGIYQIFFAEGIARTRAGEAALVVGASPALIALFGWLRGVERVDRRGMFGIALSFLGVGLIVLGRATSDTSGQDGSLFGDLLVLCGAICWAAYTVFLIPYTRRLNGLWIIALALIGGSVLLVATGARQIMRVSWTAIPMSAYWAILYAGLAGLVVAYILWYRGVKVLGPTRTHLYANLQPLIALIVAWLTLGERPTAWQGLGAATIVTGVLLTRVHASAET